MPRSINAEKKSFWALDWMTFEKVMFICKNFCFDLLPHCVLMTIMRTHCCSNGKNTLRTLSIFLLQHSPSSDQYLAFCFVCLWRDYNILLLTFAFYHWSFPFFQGQENCRRWYTQMNFLFLDWKLMLVSFQKDETKVFVLFVEKWTKVFSSKRLL